MTVEDFVSSMTPEDQYWIGYLRADGSIPRTRGLNNFVIAFGQTHRQPVEALAAYLKAKRPVRVCLDSSGYRPDIESYFLQSANKAKLFYELGVKTEALSSLLFDSPHFWRGMIDGDGTLAIYKVPVVQLVGTHFDMVKFSGFLAQHGLGVSVYPHKTIFRCIFNGNKAVLATRLIYGCGPSHLQYKRDKAEEIMALSLSTHFNAFKVSA